MPTVRALIISPGATVVLSHAVHVAASVCPSPAPPKHFSKHTNRVKPGLTPALDADAPAVESTDPAPPAPSDPLSLNSRSVALILSTLRSHSSTTTQSQSACYTFEIDLGSLHVTVHDGAQDPATALPSTYGGVEAALGGGSLGYMTAIVHATSDPLHHNFHTHHETFREKAAKIGRRFYSRFAGEMEGMVGAEAKGVERGLRESTAASLSEETFCEDPETKEEFVGFELEVVAAELESIFLDEVREKKAETRRKSLDGVRARTEWGVSEE